MKLLWYLAEQAWQDGFIYIGQNQPTLVAGTSNKILWLAAHHSRQPLQRSDISPGLSAATYSLTNDAVKAGPAAKPSMVLT